MPDESGPTLSSSGRICLTGLTESMFVSKTDKMALDNLKRLPMLETFIRKFNELALDKFYYSHNTASAVRCSEKQYATIYAILQDACAILDAPEPELYMRYDPNANAHTAGVERTFIVVNSAIADTFTDDELLFVIGHEMGHVKCGHMLYAMMAGILLDLVRVAGSVTFGIGSVAGKALLSAFFEWKRQAEFSCDRAGLLACQNPRPALSALMKLGGGSSRFNSEMNVEAFLDQAREHREMTGLEGVAKAILFILFKWQMSHPHVVHRAKLLDEWSRSSEYRTIMANAASGMKLG